MPVITPEQYLNAFDRQGMFFPRQATRFSAAARSFEKIDFTGDCWLWTGGVQASNDGFYGVQTSDFWRKPFKTSLVHRQLFMAFEGVMISPEKQIDHLCQRKSCVRPDHLDAVSKQENFYRYLATKETCVNGHPYTLENRIKNTTGTRCKLCHRERERARKKFPEPLHLQLSGEQSQEVS